jgi:uncharacterized protein
VNKKSDYKMKSSLIAMLVFLLLAQIEVQAQEYVSPLQPVEVGKSPGVKVKRISKTRRVQTYVLIFSPGDEVRSGLTEFARKYNVKSAQYSAIGDATFVKVAFFDYDRKMFKAIPINEPSEVASLTGDIALFNGNPVAHTHVGIATEDGSLKGGHLLELIVGPTLEVFVTVYRTPLHKKLDQRYDAAVIDPSLEK